MKYVFNCINGFDKNLFAIFAGNQKLKYENRDFKRGKSTA